MRNFIAQGDSGKSVSSISHRRAVEETFQRLTKSNRYRI